MRVLLVACLLIGSISCVPVWKDSGSNSADTSRKPLPGRGESSGPGSSSSLPSLPNPSSANAPERPAPHDAVSSAGPGSYSSFSGVYSSPNMAEGPNSYGGYAGFGAEVYTSPEVTEYRVAYAAAPAGGYDGSAPAGSYDGSAPAGGYGGYYASPYEGDGSYGYVSAPQDENGSSGSATNSGVSEESPEPVFSDVSDLEPVYSFRSRSSYQQGRAMFAQSRYTPGESVLPPMPVYKPISRTPSKQSSPAKAPTKGGF